MEYEICYLIGESKESNLEKIRKEVENAIKKNQGKLKKEEFVKKRRLAYQIKKEARGTYVAKRFVLPTKDERDEKFSGVDFIAEITKEINLNQNVLRFVIVKAEDLPELKLLLKKEDTQKKNVGGKSLTEKKVESLEKKERDEDGSKKKRKEENKKVIKEKEEKNNTFEKEVSEIRKDKKKNDSKKDISDKDIDDKLDEILNI